MNEIIKELNEIFYVSKDIMKKVGYKEAYLIAVLENEEDYFSKNNGLDDEGYFLYDNKFNIKEILMLSSYQQRKLLNHLQELNLISIKTKSTKRYVKINAANILALIEAK